MKIHENGFWLNPTKVGHLNDIGLKDGLLSVLKAEQLGSVLDLGCGPGFYLEAFKSAGYDAAGYDGNPYTPELTSGLGQVADLTKEFVLDRKYSCVISLEVGEHIPEEHEQTFIANLIKYVEEWVILSWAVPGQGGDGHVNCKPNDYIEEVMGSHGFSRMIIHESYLRSCAQLPWFKNTLMVFRRK